MVQKKINVELEIILMLLNEQHHVREMAKLISKPHATISRATSKLVDENIIDYKIKGKNKVFFLKKTLASSNKIYMAEHYKLEKFIEKYPNEGILIDEIVKKTKGKIAIIFGSYAKFSAKIKSDIDIYIDTKDANLKNEIEKIDNRISVKIGKFDTNNLLIKEIIKNHIIITGLEEFYEKHKIFS